MRPVNATSTSEITPAHGTLQMLPVETAAERKTFIKLPLDLYANDPHYIQPLEYELGARLDLSLIHI